MAAPTIELDELRARNARLEAELERTKLLAVAGENRERRRQRTHPARKKPELIARAPNQVWSWDITKLQGPERGVYYELFVIIDIFSR